jgi:hypothetical protein
MATISPNNTERVAVPASTANVAIPNSSKYTKFLFVLEGCTTAAEYRIVADMGQGGISPLPLEGLPNAQGMRWGAEVTVVAAGPSAFQVTLTAPAVAGLVLVHSGGDANATTGTLHVSMAGSVYSQGLN